ncbi:3-oxoacyl-[acyl-carrier-protein] synthase III C-terminal domain-containing protein [Echinicola jeungdonensis]|uniref:3-oxoacyl-[acyl-carrier-protein] synthase III C-terminal domain-containing protein n=1 Tax=Echinicola jeungdonensis TaxID=709343 RepID=UPI0025B40418|nr:3-oxoacyl-[acyl-carrier-protein] synthase III C-terminal domain-containing protein [Echinicola jeungdonensis]MDN3667766.1 3-oxoacyl-[acyl-carrier-protein] synthase III C-terminal domain-containing protein [Echinicola jeungdonensis]
MNTLLKSGAISRGMVASGENLTHVTNTAQKEIESFMDSRLACLTLGDAGAALILEQSESKETGFHEIELQTFGRYSEYCIVNVSQNGGWIMQTDAVNLTEVGIKSGAQQSIQLLQKAGWLPDRFQHLILHQTSKTSLKSARDEINKIFNHSILNDQNTINNLENRGNTASTSHFIALSDQIRNNKIKSGDKVIFGITASGLTTGTALYTFDDLPNRLNHKKLSQNIEHTKNLIHSSKIDKLQNIRIGIEKVGTVTDEVPQSKDSLELLQNAAENCLIKSSYQKNDIGLLIHSGVYRSGYILEPAYATLLSGRLNMNATFLNPNNKKTLAFDIFNGSLGFLNACFVAQHMIGMGKCQQAMIVATEYENNANQFPDKLLGVRTTASATIMHTPSNNNTGFSNFSFLYKTSYLNSYSTYCSTAEVYPYLHIKKDPDLEQKYIDNIYECIEDLLEKEGLFIDQIKWIFPPQISFDFIVNLSQQLNLPLEKFIDVVQSGPDLFSSSIPIAFEYAQEKHLIKEGDIGLMIAAGSGIQVGAAIYHF